MTNEQIKQAAIEHIRKIVGLPFVDMDDYRYEQNIFIAGAESRQPEIDELVNELREIQPYLNKAGRILIHKLLKNYEK